MTFFPSPRPSQALALSLLLGALAFVGACGGCETVCPDDCPDSCSDSGLCPGNPEPAAPDVTPEPGSIGTPCDDAGDCDSGACFGGACSECDDASDCDATATCVDGTCEDDDTCASGDRCGGGGDCCPPSTECIADVCRAACETVRCGPDLGQCCGGDEVCYGGGCAVVGAPCVTAVDCDAGQVCELDLGVCLDEDVVGTCEYIPPPGVFQPEIECRWTPNAGDANPADDDVVMAPVVGNLTDDNGDGVTNRLDVPEILFVTYDLEGGGCCNIAGTLRVVSGACDAQGGMTTLASLSEPGIDNSGGLALGDLDGDGVMEIVAMTIVDGQPQGTVAFTRDIDDGSAWSVLWHNDLYPTFDIHTRGATQPALADLDGNGTVEVIVGNIVLDGSDGTLVWDGAVTSAGLGGIGNNAFLGPVSTAVDLDADGTLEVLAGNTVYEANGDVRFTYTYTTEGSGCGGTLPCDGYTAAANFDDDPEGEVVIVRQGEVFVLEHTGELLARVPIPVDDCANNESGPPTIADFDGDGRAEIGTAAGDFYVVIDLDCTLPLDDACESEGVLWAVPNVDCSSRVTASSVFDFEGDGAAEVIYADEDTFRIFRGTDGFELFVDETHGSHTRLEMPVIADVDNDGNAEILIPENSSRNGTPGVEVWGDVLDNWVFTRRIWNQHSYHVTHVTEDGVVTGARQNWAVPDFNNFRQNSQGEGIFWAPDLTLDGLRLACSPLFELSVRFTVHNTGSRVVGAGVPVAVYIEIEGEEQLLGVVNTTGELFPGSSEAFELEFDVTAYGRNFRLRAAADDDGTGVGQNNECVEDNNDASGDVLCFVSG